MNSLFILSVCLTGLYWSSVLVLSENNFFKTLQAGEYLFEVKDYRNCKPNGKLQFNFYFIQKSENSTILKGNLTSQIAIDDTLMMESIASLKNSVGVWKENIFVHKTPRACSMLKHFLGKSWIQFVNSIGVTNPNCPLIAGTYIAPGADISFFKNTNIPKIFFYGTYKLKIVFSRKNEIFGCINIDIVLKRQ